jgi:hypothetical protein
VVADQMLSGGKHVGSRLVSGLAAALTVAFASWLPLPTRHRAVGAVREESQMESSYIPTLFGV